MAADVWELVREAFATKAAAVTTLRGADTNTDSPGAAFPWLKVLPVSYELRSQDGASEDYRLTIPAELLCSKPAGRQRSEPTASAVARDLQEAWWTKTVPAGLEGTVIRWWIESMTHGLTEYDGFGLDGYRVLLYADVHEVLPTARL